MGEKWVLADGATYTYNEHPYLWEFYKQEELTGEWLESNSTIFSSDSNSSVVKSKKINNKNIILKSRSVVVVNSINGTEINYNEYTVTTETNCYISDIDYGNGYYVAVCSASYQEFVYVSTDLISWTKY